LKTAWDRVLAEKSLPANAGAADDGMPAARGSIGAVLRKFKKLFLLVT